MTIDLRSDTVTRPTAAMRQAMATAEVGDDVLGDDPTIARLEKRTAEVLGKEAAVYMPSGTMTNQVAVRTHTEPGDEIFLDANENSFGSPVDVDYSRYPDPRQMELRNRLALKHQVSSSNVFVGNGSDEAIDLLIRIFCRPQIDSIIICPPTYGMYEVAAAINDVNVVRIPLRKDFSIDAGALKNVFTEATKLLFLCSPNNPTGNLADPCLQRRLACDSVYLATPGRQSSRWIRPIHLRDHRTTRCAIRRTVWHTAFRGQRVGIHDACGNDRLCAAGVGDCQAYVAAP
jgi:cystathionine beta-lyase/cystathionine gamma-synthase